MELTRFIIEIVIGLTAVVALVISLNGRSQRREIHWGFEPASKKAFEEHVSHNTKRHDQLFKGIEAAKAEAAKELKAKADEISKEVVSLGKDMASLLAMNQRQSEDIKTINSDIKQLLKRS